MDWIFITFGIVLRALTAIEFNFSKYRYELIAIGVFAATILFDTVLESTLPADGGFTLVEFPLLVAILLALMFARQILSGINLASTGVLFVVAVYIFFETVSMQLVTSHLFLYFFAALLILFGGVATYVLMQKSLPNVAIRYIASLSFLALSIASYFLVSYALFVTEASNSLNSYTAILYGFVSLQFYAYAVYLFFALLPTPSTLFTNQSIPNSSVSSDPEAKLRSAVRHGLATLAANFIAVKDFLKSGTVFHKPSTLSGLQVGAMVLGTVVILAINYVASLIDPVLIAGIVLALMGFITSSVDLNDKIVRD